MKKLVKFKKNVSTKGFTLIELLVVIAIIGILSAFLTTNYITVRVRARDAQRKSDLRQVQSALELYRSDTGGYLAVLLYASLGNCNSGTSFGNSPTCTSIYMQKLPADPLNTSPNVYSYAGTSSSYCLRACLENASDSQKDAVVYGINNPTVSSCVSISSPTCTTSYSLQNP